MYTVPLPTALVINDDPSQLHLMVGLLEKDGLLVVHCQSAEEALHILDERGTVEVIRCFPEKVIPLYDDSRDDHAI